MRLVSRNKQRAGLKGKRAGDSFEREFELLVVKYGAWAINIPTGAKIVRNSFGKLIPLLIQTPFDFLVMKNGKVLLIDCKSVDRGHTYSYSKLTMHQLGSFSNAKRFGIVGGYCIKFVEHSSIVFFNFDKLDVLKPRESLRMDDGISLKEAIELYCK